jgi:hypothetical protein
MPDIWILVAVEDQLSEAVALKMLAQSGKPFRVAQILRRDGAVYLKTRMQQFNRSARKLPFLVLADLDNPKECPPERVRSWLGSQRQEPNLIFRIAVMEVESWVLADREAVAGFLKVAINKIPPAPDEILEPKELLVSLAQRSRSRHIREDLCPKPGATSKVGPAYNGRLSEFVRAQWDPLRACACSPSLSKAMKSLKEFTPGTSVIDV